MIGLIFGIRTLPSWPFFPFPRIDGEPALALPPSPEGPCDMLERSPL